jgi:hypothetical protein
VRSPLDGVNVVVFHENSRTNSKEKMKKKTFDHYYPTHAPTCAINLFDGASNVSKRYFSLFGVSSSFGADRFLYDVAF